MIDSTIVKEKRRLLIHALNTIMFFTCIRFTILSGAPTSHYAYVNTRTKGCSSMVGKIPTALDQNNVTFQKVDLAPRGCFYHHTVVHEFLHLLGLPHEHQRFDRDIYISVNAENVEEGLDSNFYKMFYKDSPITPYRYRSVMHYSSPSFGKHGTYTMTKKLDNSTINSPGLVYITDLNRINFLYGCSQNDTHTDLHKISDDI